MEVTDTRALGASGLGLGGCRSAVLLSGPWPTPGTPQASAAPTTWPFSPGAAVVLSQTGLLLRAPAGGVSGGRAGGGGAGRHPLGQEGGARLLIPRESSLPAPQPGTPCLLARPLLTAHPQCRALGRPVGHPRWIRSVGLPTPPETTPLLAPTAWPGPCMPVVGGQAPGAPHPCSQVHTSDRTDGRPAQHPQAPA